jgi:hypothetical protein
VRLARSGGVLGTIVAGALLFTGAFGARAALVYDVTLGAGARWDDNFHLDPRTTAAAGEPELRQPVREMIYTAVPGLTLNWAAERDRLQLTYRGEYSLFRGDEQRDSFWVHAGSADLSWRRWAPLFLEAREERSRVPRTQEREGEAYVDQVDRNRIFARTGLVSTQGTRTTLELAYRGELETYTASGGAPSAVTATDEATGPAADAAVDRGVDSLTAALDRVERQYLEVLVRHRWTPLWGGELRAAYGQVDRRLAADFTEMNATLAIDQRWSERLTLRYRVTWRREDEKTPAANAVAKDPAAATVPKSERDFLLLGAEIRGDLERGGFWNLAYQDDQQDQSDGDTLETGRVSAAARFRTRTDSSLELGGWHENREYRLSGRTDKAWGPTLAARWMIAPWAAFDLGGSWMSTTIREAGKAEIEDRTTRVSAGLVLLLFGRVQLEAGYGYRKNDSTDPLRTYANNLVFALLTVHFTPVGPGRLPASYASGLVAGGSPSGGSEQPVAGGGATGGAR